MLHACFDQQGAAAISIVETGKLYRYTGIRVQVNGHRVISNVLLGLTSRLMPPLSEALNVIH